MLSVKIQFRGLNLPTTQVADSKSANGEIISIGIIMKIYIDEENLIKTIGLVCFFLSFPVDCSTV